MTTGEMAAAPTPDKNRKAMISTKRPSGHKAVSKGPAVNRDSSKSSVVLRPSRSASLPMMGAIVAAPREYAMAIQVTMVSWSLQSATMLEGTAAVKPPHRLSTAAAIA